MSPDVYERIDSQIANEFENGAWLSRQRHQTRSKAAWPPEPRAWTFAVRARFFGSQLSGDYDLATENACSRARRWTLGLGILISDFEKGSVASPIEVR